MVEKFDCIVVGAGMSGNAAAYTLAKKGLRVLQLERGEYSGSKNVQGAILYADMLEKLIPDFREEAPLERHLVEQRFWMMDDRAHVGIITDAIRLLPALTEAFRARLSPHSRDRIAS